ncbi:MAG TPA: sigma-70 family RNA polymerase sigma factor [Sedimentisphaerales bacterium]|nr:sigma-70 family RNA polymerase sigma factor [Sedimentisphaerales bacterium]
MEDKWLIYELNSGSKEALCRIYEKYRDDLVRIAAGLLNNVSAAEDVVQEVFLNLVHSADKYKIRTSLKGYLITCVANRARNSNRGKCLQSFVCLDDVTTVAAADKAPDQCIACDEEYQQLYEAIAQLPYEQKEVVILHVQGKMKFREIAKLQSTPIKTTLSRYNYGLNKLRSMFNSEVKNEISR